MSSSGCTCAVGFPLPAYAHASRCLVLTWQPVCAQTRLGIISAASTTPVGSSITTSRVCLPCAIKAKTPTLLVHFVLERCFVVFVSEVYTVVLWVCHPTRCLVLTFIHSLRPGVSVYHEGGVDVGSAIAWYKPPLSPYMRAMQCPVLKLRMPLQGRPLRLLGSAPITCIQERGEFR